MATAVEPPVPSGLMVVQAMYDFHEKKAALVLTAGDFYEVVETVNEHWFAGYQLVDGVRTGKRGFVARAYVSQPYEVADRRSLINGQAVQEFTGIGQISQGELSPTGHGGVTETTNPSDVSVNPRQSEPVTDTAGRAYAVGDDVKNVTDGADASTTASDKANRNVLFPRGDGSDEDSDSDNDSDSDDEASPKKLKIVGLSPRERSIVTLGVLFLLFLQLIIVVVLVSLTDDPFSPTLTAAEGAMVNAAQGSLVSTQHNLLSTQTAGDGTVTLGASLFSTSSLVRSESLQPQPSTDSGLTSAAAWQTLLRVLELYDDAQSGSDNVFSVTLRSPVDLAAQSDCARDADCRTSGDAQARCVESVWSQSVRTCWDALWKDASKRASIPFDVALLSSKHRVCRCSAGSGRAGRLCDRMLDSSFAGASSVDISQINSVLSDIPTDDGSCPSDVCALPYAYNIPAPIREFLDGLPRRPRLERNPFHVTEDENVDVTDQTVRESIAYDPRHRVVGLQSQLPAVFFPFEADVPLISDTDPVTGVLALFISNFSLAVDTNVRVDQLPMDVAMRLDLPDGWDFSSLGMFQSSSWFKPGDVTLSNASLLLSTGSYESYGYELLSGLSLVADVELSGGTSFLRKWDDLAPSGSGVSGNTFTLRAYASMDIVSSFLTSSIHASSVTPSATLADVPVNSRISPHFTTASVDEDTLAATLVSFDLEYDRDAVFALWDGRAWMHRAVVRVYGLGDPASGDVPESEGAADDFLAKVNAQLTLSFGGAQFTPAEHYLRMEVSGLYKTGLLHLSGRVWDFQLPSLDRFLQLDRLFGTVYINLPPSGAGVTSIKKTLLSMSANIPLFGDSGELFLHGLIDENGRVAVVVDHSLEISSAVSAVVDSMCRHVFGGCSRAVRTALTTVTGWLAGAEDQTTGSFGGRDMMVAFATGVMRLDDSDVLELMEAAIDSADIGGVVPGWMDGGNSLLLSEGVRLWYEFESGGVGTSVLPSLLVDALEFLGAIDSASIVTERYCGKVQEQDYRLFAHDGIACVEGHHEMVAVPTSVLDDLSARLGLQVPVTALSDLGFFLELPDIVDDILPSNDVLSMDGITVSVEPVGGLSVGLSVTGSLRLDNGDGGHSDLLVSFEGSYVAPATVSLSGSMIGRWENVGGLQGLDVSDLYAQIGIGPGPSITSLAFTGTADWGLDEDRPSGSVSLQVVVDPLDGRFAFAFSLQRVRLSDLLSLTLRVVDTASGNQVAPQWATEWIERVDAIRVHSVDIRFAPTAWVTPAGESIAQGFRLAGNASVFGVDAALEIVSETRDVEVASSTVPIYDFRLSFQLENLDLSALLLPLTSALDFVLPFVEQKLNQLRHLCDGGSELTTLGRRARTIVGGGEVYINGRRIGDAADAHVLSHRTTVRTLDTCVGGGCLDPVCLPEICIDQQCVEACIPPICGTVCFPPVQICTPRVCAFGGCVGGCSPQACVSDCTPEVCSTLCTPGPFCTPGSCTPEICVPELCISDVCGLLPLSFVEDAADAIRDFDGLVVIEHLSVDDLSLWDLMNGEGPTITVRIRVAGQVFEASGAVDVGILLDGVDLSAAADAVLTMIEGEMTAVASNVADAVLDAVCDLPVFSGKCVSLVGNIEVCLPSLC